MKTRLGVESGGSDPRYFPEEVHKSETFTTPEGTPRALPELFPERRYFQIEYVASNSPAAQAGLRKGDRTIAVDGIPVTTPEAFFYSQQEQPEASHTLTIMWGNSAEEITVTLTPAYDNELKRFRLGVEWSLKFERILPPEQDGRRRATVPFLDQAGKPIAFCDIELAGKETVYDEEYYPGSWVCKEKRALELISLVLRPSRDNNQQGYDVLQKFNTQKVPILMAIEPINFARAFHDPVAKQVVIPPISTPEDLAVLLHELRHTEQRSDTVLEKVMNHYGTGVVVRREDEWTPRTRQAIRKLIDELLEMFPQVARGMDQKKLSEELPGLLETVGKISDKEKIQQASAKGAALHVLYDKPSFEAKSLAERLALLYKTLPYGPYGSEPITPEDRQRLVDNLKGLGIILPPAPTPQSAHFSAVELKDSMEFSNFCHHVTKDLERQCLDTQYDIAAGETILTIGFKWKAGKEFRTIEWRVPRSREQFEMDQRQRGIKQALAEEIQKTRRELQKRILNLELKPGVTVLDVISLPQWMAERDAEAGSLKGLRRIRKEAGFNFFTPYLARRIPADLLAEIKRKREEAQRPLPAGVPDSLLKVIERLEGEDAARNVRTVLDRIHLYMLLIEASSAKLRALYTSEDPVLV